MFFLVCLCDIAGMVTRKSLMLYKLVECHEREIELVQTLQDIVRKKYLKRSS